MASAGSRETQVMTARVEGQEIANGLESGDEDEGGEEQELAVGDDIAKEVGVPAGGDGAPAGPAPPPRA